MVLVKLDFDFGDQGFRLFPDLPSWEAIRDNLEQRRIEMRHEVISISAIEYHTIAHFFPEAAGDGYGVFPQAYEIEDQDDTSYKFDPSLYVGMNVDTAVESIKCLNMFEAVEAVAFGDLVAPGFREDRARVWDDAGNGKVSRVTIG